LRRARKLIARVEATPLGTDLRFIVTNLEGRSKALYEKVFCTRGAVAPAIDPAVVLAHESLSRRLRLGPGDHGAHAFAD
jgi:hypothetical protein